MITCPRGYLTTDKIPGHESLNDFKDFKGKMKIGLRRSLDIIKIMAQYLCCFIMSKFYSCKGVCRVIF